MRVRGEIKLGLYYLIYINLLKVDKVDIVLSLDKQKID